MDSLKKRCGCGAILGLREGCAVCAGKERARLEAKRQEEAAKVPLHLSRKAGMSVQGITGWAHEMMGSNAGVEPRFKVGDRVRMAKPHIAGHVGTVTDVRSGLVVVDWGDVGPLIHDPGHIELFPEKFSVGDRVMVDSFGDFLNGMEGRITRIGPGQRPYFVDFGLGGRLVNYKADELELIPEPKP